jgi:hypothetical protein
LLLLAIVAREIDNLAANMLAAVASPALLKLLAEYESEQARLEGTACLDEGHAVSDDPAASGAAATLRGEVGRLRETLDVETVRDEAAEVLATLIESVTIYPGGEHGPEAEALRKGRQSAHVGDKRRRRP